MDYAQIAAIRFGYGPSPRQASPGSAADILAVLTGKDRLGQRYPIISGPAAQKMVKDYLDLRRAYVKGGGPKALEAFRHHRQEVNRQIDLGLQMRMARAVDDAAGFRERLHQFWTDHFTVVGKKVQNYVLTLAHGEEAVRPHLAGRFSGMLRAATTHAAMIQYLDQSTSIGPDSPLARRRPDRHMGLNENLARELMELHTLGVNGSYSQDDVRQLAELLTGLSYSSAKGAGFRPEIAEEGAETVLGQSYGGDGPARLGDIYAVLDDLARHPDTAQHLAHKLAVHFVSDDPPADLVAAMANAYQAHDTALLPVYEVLLTHPAALAALGEKVRQPLVYIPSGLRALGFDGRTVAAWEPGVHRKLVTTPLRGMGQFWLKPGGPDGWPEAAEAWITPQSLSERLNWAMSGPKQVLDTLPDPVEFAHTALGARATPALLTAVPRAESRAEAVGLVLAAPEFNRC
ncbi:DUF1800 domain-containing protein [Phaeovulum sp. W22_SRMD_FR3]|uniref:DUF1800 domain-containing protein n=1 Tax=Phaeovulum sp. W22_SRMD_FR3 TaxID=3240274 RepID=UPI003F9C5EC5